MPKKNASKSSQIKRHVGKKDYSGGNLSFGQRLKMALRKTGKKRR